MTSPEQEREFKLLTNSAIRLTNEMQALSQRSEPQKPVRSGWRQIIRGPHLTDMGQKSLTVKAMQSVTLLMHKVWEFITPHIITEHTEDPGALQSSRFSLSLSLVFTPSHCPPRSSTLRG